jgi:hypothetical protein
MGVWAALRCRSTWSALGPHGIGNRWSLAGTSGHGGQEEAAGHHAFPPTTSAGEAARKRLRIPPAPVSGGLVRLTPCRRCAGGSAVHPRRPRPPVWREDCAHAADPPITCRCLRADGGAGSAQPQVPGGVCRRWLLRGVRRGPWPRSFLSALWSAVPVWRPARRDMAWGGRPGRPLALSPTGLRRVSRRTRAT